MSGHARPGENVLRVLPAEEADGELFVRRLEIEARPVGIVDEEARHRGLQVALVIEEGDGDVVGVEHRAARVGAGVVRAVFRPGLAEHVRVEHVGVPERVGAARAVEAPGFLAQPVEGVLPLAAAGEQELVVERGVGGRIGRRHRRRSRRPGCRRRGGRRAGRCDLPTVRVSSGVTTRTASGVSSTVNSALPPSAASAPSTTASVGCSSNCPPRLILSRRMSARRTSTRRRSSPWSSVSSMPLARRVRPPAFCVRRKYLGAMRSWSDMA